MSGEEAIRAQPRTTRVRDGRLIAGVCVGLPEVWGLDTTAYRTAFVIAGLCGGVGVIVYLACWLVLPGPRDDPDAGRMRDLVTVRDVAALAWGIGGVVLALLLAAVAAAATVFGFGWVVFRVAAAVLVATLARRGGPRFTGLVAVFALAVPAVAVGLSPVRLAPHSYGQVVRPVDAAAVSGRVYRSNFNTLLIDLRHTNLPAPRRERRPSDVGGARVETPREASVVVGLRIEAGLQRTVVALPEHRCVRVLVNYDVHTFAGQFASELTGNHPSFPYLLLFSRLYGTAYRTDPHGMAASPALGQVPTLTIDFSSQGGGLYVRDYPNVVNPLHNPRWPGTRIGPNERHVRLLGPCAA